MATSETLFETIDVQFCHCPICLRQYKEPKQLPCLHRFCSDCLKQYIEVSKRDNSSISCPECKVEFSVPSDGVDGFKTDVFMKSIIEYVQLRKSLEDEQPRNCCDCLKNEKAAAYCFKCNGVLCEECYNYHITKTSLKDHKQYTLSLEDLKSEHLTLEKFADFKEAPRCQSHPEDLSRLCCRTCDNLPICVTCTYGSHKNHDITDVSILANEERETINSELESLRQYKDNMYNMIEILNGIEKELISFAGETKESYQERYETAVKIVEKDAKKLEVDFEVKKTRIAEEKERNLMDQHEKTEKEIEEIKQKCETICTEIEKKAETKLNELEQKHQEQIEKSQEKLEILERELKNIISSVEESLGGRMERLQNISQTVEGSTKRFENLAATAGSVLEMRDDWTAVRCVPDMCTAIAPLSVEMRRDFPQLETLSLIRINVEVEEEETSPVDIEGVKENKWFITGITSSGDGNLVITGPTSEDQQSHVTIISMKGNILSQETVNSGADSLDCYCAYLSKFKIATVCDNYEISVYDVWDGSNIKKNVGDVMRSWKSDQYVFCIATDTATSHILVGGYKSKDVYVFNDELNYSHTLTLPEKIEYPYDMVVDEGNLLVCDNLGGRACVVAMEGSQGKLLHEFPKPDLVGDDLKPTSLCTDKNGFIYMLWKGKIYGERRQALAQYSQDGRHLLTTKLVDDDVKCITAVEKDGTEKLVLTTEGGKLSTYHIGSVCVV